MNVVDLNAHREERHRQGYRDHADAVDRDREREIHRGERVQLLELRATGLERHRDQLERLLADAATLIAGPGENPLPVIQLLESMDALRVPTDELDEHDLLTHSKPPDWIFPRGYVYPGREQCLIDLRDRPWHKPVARPVDWYVQLLRETDPDPSWRMV